VSDVVEVAGGKVRGVDGDAVRQFLGIPYAASPSGALRWRPPQPPIPWSGIRPASDFGAMAPQSPATPGFSLPGDPSEQSEDCLSLNVWTPGLDGLRRPVMVWIHGGGFSGGTGAGLLYRGEELARRGNVVVVTINYRLGALGFLGHRSLTDERDGGVSGNWGLLDQVAALRWVGEYIESFGGNAQNVTIFGESAGGMCVAALMSSPAARGLFHRAIVQSGPPYAHSLLHAQRIGDDLSEVLGLDAADRATWQSVPAAALVDATQTLQSVTPPPGQLPLPFLPVVDGTFLPRSPYEGIAEGAGAPTPLLIGTNRDELTLFALGTPDLGELDQQRLEDWIGLAAPGAHPVEVVETYRNERAARGETLTPHDLWIAIGTDLVFRWPSLRLAAAHHRWGSATFVYLFTWESPVFDGILGASHALEIPFVFGTAANPVVAAYCGDGPDSQALSQHMLDAWAAFAWTGDPSHPHIGGWPAWDGHRRSTMVFGRRSAVVDGPRDQELAVWSKVAPLVGSEPMSETAP
jgi:para-nitrobenzyl esterase